MPHTQYIRWVPAPDNIKRIGKIHELLYVYSLGLIGGRLDGLDILLLTTQGRKTGRERRVPLPYFRDGSRYVLVASFGGNPTNPAWFTNLLENPNVGMQRGSRRWRAQARVTQDPERSRLWEQITHEHPRYLNYQTKTPREIPIVLIDGPD
jgi:deazaflavin-dependent oxidoreductase (nitroreductase family)